MASESKESLVGALQDMKGLDHKTRMRLFMGPTILDLLLVLVISSSLVMTVSYGFNSAPQFRGDPAMVVAAALPLLGALALGSWSKKSLLPSAVLTIGFAVGIITFAIVMSPEPLFSEYHLNDSAGSYGIFAIVATLIPVLTYLLSRRTWGLAILLVLSVGSCGVIEYLYPDWITVQPGIAVTLVGLMGIAAQYIFQTYKSAVYSAARVKRTSFVTATLFAILMAVASVAIGVGVFYGAVNSLDLSTPQFHPFEKRVSPPIDESSSSYDSEHRENDQTSDDTADDEDPVDDDSGGGATDLAGTLLESPVGNMVASVLGYDLEDPNTDQGQAAYAVFNILRIIATVLAVLLAFLLIMSRRWLRTWRLKMLERRGRSLGYRVWYLYEFFMKRLQRMKVAPAPQLTPLEYAISRERQLEFMDQGTDGVTFLEVSRLYMDVSYGAYQPTDDDYDRVVRFYRAFFKNARKQSGWPKWIFWRYWRI